LSSSCFSCLSLALVMLNDEFLWISDRRQRLVMAQSYENPAKILEKPVGVKLLAPITQTHNNKK